jgi:phosphoribosylformimino-5-aminoimidazole carboxamide ribotide isomerase
VILYPAIDIRDGRVVRLSQGEATRQTVYEGDPAAQAEAFAAAGARWVHVVDLDRAFGSGENDAAVARVIAALDGRVRVQVGGGSRTIERVAALADAGASRIVIGTVAVTDPAFVKRAIALAGPERIAVGIDAREGRVALRGWVETSDTMVADLARRVVADGARTLIYTEIARDGMLTGPDLAGATALQRAGASSGVAVIASGGVATLDHLRAAAAAGLAGAIVGRALYERRFTLEEALAACASS